MVLNQGPPHVALQLPKGKVKGLFQASLTRSPRADTGAGHCASICSEVISSFRIQTECSPPLLLVPGNTLSVVLEPTPRSKCPPIPESLEGKLEDSTSGNPCTEPAGLKAGVRLCGVYALLGWGSPQMQSRTSAKLQVETGTHSSAYLMLHTSDQSVHFPETPEIEFRESHFQPPLSRDSRG